MTHGDGHARVPITRLPLTPSPNLWREEKTKDADAVITHIDLFTIGPDKLTSDKCFYVDI